MNDSFINDSFIKIIGNPLDFLEKFPNVENNFILFKYPFDTYLTREKMNAQGYNYVSILTDGAINPKLNFGYSDISELFLETSKGQKFYINAEITNIPIAGNEYIALTYTKPTNYFVSGGYGNLFIVLSQKKLIYFPIKENAQALIDEDVIDSAAKLIWFGMGGLDSKNGLAIPFIPPHNYVHYHMKISGGVGGTATLTPYSIYNNTYANPITIDTSGDLNIEFCSYCRFELNIDNTSGTTNFKGAFSFAI